MAIFIRHIFDTKEQCEHSKELCHRALKGSPAYVNSEIAVVDEPIEHCYTLCVGIVDPDNDLWIINDHTTHAKKT